MIRQFLFTILLFTIVMHTQAQKASDGKVIDTKKHRVIMQVTQGDSLYQLAVIGQIRNIKKSLPNAEIEVVCHSQGLPMLVADKSKVAKHIEELSKQQVIFAACENTMQRHKISQQEQLPETITVPSGLAEIIVRQEECWVYVKGGF